MTYNLPVLQKVSLLVKLCECYCWA